MFFNINLFIEFEVLRSSTVDTTGAKVKAFCSFIIAKSWVIRHNHIKTLCLFIKQIQQIE